MRISARPLQCAFVMLIISLAAMSAQAQTYTSDPIIGDFTSTITSYATFSNFGGYTCSTDSSCPATPNFTPNSAELAKYAYRVFNGTLTCAAPAQPFACNGISSTNNWIEASFPEPVSTIVVFPNIDHFGSSYDGYQYQIAGSNDGVTWTPLFDVSSAAPCSGAGCITGGNGEPFTGTFTGTPPSKVNNVLSNYPTTGLTSGCAAGFYQASPQTSPNVTPAYNPALCTVGYIATFTFPTAYQYYAFGTSTLAVGNNEQEFSAVGTTQQVTGRALGLSNPTSGALLSIISSDGTVKIYRYDSQIHSGSVQAVPVGSDLSNCNSTDATYPTDAYVLQGGSWTGCDPGDGFEMTDNNIFGAGQAVGKADIATDNTATSFGSGFHVETHYGSTGSVTVKNNTGSPFSGTISLSGNPTISGAPTPACPITPSATANGGAPLISSGAGLGVGASVTLSIPGDSSACGGFNAPQMQPLSNGIQTTYNIGKDYFNITPLNANSGDYLKVLPVPVPAGPVGTPPFATAGMFGVEPVTSLPASLSPTTQFSATNYPNQACVPVASFSASMRDASFNPQPTLNPVCPELQLDCVLSDGITACSDHDTFLWTANVGVTVDPIVGPGIGGVHALTQHNSECPTNGFNIDTLAYYIGDPPSIDYPSKLSNSCIVNTYEPTTTATANGATIFNSFNGFQAPVTNCPTLPPPNAPPPCTPQPVQAGSTIPLIWVSTTTSGGTSTSGAPITNLELCTDAAEPAPPNCGSLPGIGTPADPNTYWVWVGYVQIACPAGGSTTGTILDDTAGASGLQNLGALGTAPPGTYQFNWKTPKSLKGSCATPVLVFSTGATSFNVADFQFK